MFFLDVPVKSVSAVNRRTDGDAISYACEAKILNGIALIVNGQ